MSTFSNGASPPLTFAMLREAVDAMKAAAKREEERQAEVARRIRDFSGQLNEQLKQEPGAAEPGSEQAIETTKAFIRRQVAKFRGVPEHCVHVLHFPEDRSYEAYVPALDMLPLYLPMPGETS